MDFYQKEIFYLNAIWEQSDFGCVGFGVMEVLETQCNLEIVIQNMPNTIKGLGKIYLIYKENHVYLGELESSNEKCKFAMSQNIQDMYMQGIQLDGEGQMEILWREGRITGVIPRFQVSFGEKQRIRENTINVEKENKKDEPKMQMYVENKKEAKRQELPDEKANISENGKQTDKTEEDCGETRTKNSEEPLQNIWEKLKNRYQIIHPYGDDREYVTLRIKDLGILQTEYQGMANNSFLLHGYFYYKYLILGKERGDQYYLGVPGIFHEREKMMALMFGFEAFDCPGGEASPGTFGYYLKSVELKASESIS